MFTRLVATLAVLSAFTSPLAADEKEDKAAKAKELRAKIVEAEKKLADLRKEYAALQYDGTTYTAAKESLWATGVPEVGTQAQLAELDHKVLDVVDDQTVVVQFGIKGTGPTFLVLGLPTKGWVDDMYVRAAGAWNVAGTAKYAGKTVFVLRPAGNASLVKAK